METRERTFLVETITLMRDAARGNAAKCNELGDGTGRGWYTSREDALSQVLYLIEEASK